MADSEAAVTGALCKLCGEPVKGLASINDDQFCHEGDSPTCYELASQGRDVGDIVAEFMEKYR